LPEGDLVKLNTKKKLRKSAKSTKGKGKGKVVVAKITAKSKATVAAKKKADNSLINNIKDNSTETDIKITIRFKSPLTLMRMLKEKLNKDGIDPVEKYFKLTSNVNTSNMVLIDPAGQVKKYNSPYEIMDDFFETRMQYYIMRKAYMMDHLKKNLVLINYKVKFIREILNDTIELRRKKRVVIDTLLVDKHYPKLNNKLDADPDSYSYDYLVKMPLDNLTQERIEALENDMKNKQASYDELNNKPERRLWVEDLKVFFSKYKKEYNVITPKKRVSAKKANSKKTSGGGAK